MYSDSHAHITSNTLFPEVEEIIASAKSAGVNTIIDIATEEEELKRSLTLQKRYLGVYTAGGVHPHDANRAEELYPIFAHAAQEKQLVAIGETGLDYHYQHSTPDQQQQSLRLHLRLALTSQLPVIIHCREAFTDFFRILDEEYQTREGLWGAGVLHCFTGTAEEAEEVLRRGFYLSLSGVVTFKKSIALQEIAKSVPLDRLLIETDSPFLAPQSKRGQKNEPAYVVEVAKKIAEIKGVSEEAIATQTSKNTQKLFSLSVLKEVN